jgi:hypothetical protein
LGVDGLTVGILDQIKHCGAIVKGLKWIVGVLIVAVKVAEAMWVAR